ncbi:4'-phosphopantetheinyl transferase family protein [Nannocystaceae bacterium ST9]
MKSFQELLEGEVIAEEVDPAGPLDELLPDERAQVERAVDKRVRDFRAGRQCAHRALGRLGEPLVPLLNDSSRAPRWPSGVVGSITHCAGLAAAVVARASDQQALGIDAEPDSPIERKLWSTIAREAEMKWLDNLAPSRAGNVAKLLFSCKESFFKLQFPSTRQMLGFEAVELQLGASLLEPFGVFSLTIMQDLPAPFRRGERLVGRFSCVGGLVRTAMQMPASGPAW